MRRKLIVVLVIFLMTSGCLGFGDSKNIDYNLESFEDTERLVGDGFGATEGKLDLLFGISHEVNLAEGAPVLFLEVRSDVITLTCPLSESMLNANCGLEMDWYDSAPTYTGAEQSKDSSGMTDITAVVWERQQTEESCAANTGQSDLVICGSAIYFYER